MRNWKFMLLLGILLGLGKLTAGDEFNTERLPIGNPQTKYDFGAVQLNQFLDTHANTVLSLDQLIERLQGFQVIMLGESHTNEHHHQMQLDIIRALTESGTKICLALEMFTPAQNEALNDYVTGKITEAEFLDRSNYFNTWGHNYRYYQPIFDYARSRQIRLYGINTRQEFTSKIGRSGIGSLTAEERSQLPPIDTSNVEHRFYIKATMEGMDAVSPAAFRNIYTAQCLWDAAMGEGAIHVAQQNPDARVIILAGSGHVAYNLGIGRIIQQRSNLQVASVLAVDIPDTIAESAMMKVKKSLEQKPPAPAGDKPGDAPKMPPMAAMHGSAGSQAAPQKIVVRSLADFIYGVPEVKQEKYPSFGFSVDEKNDRGFRIKRVLPETIA
ncbi:MAG: ChaN family lipoprotein, partial [candidate division KSB1 bacterium]|nr:ChaN family lipoprotein [candidate division KSB1 bacterium]